VSPLASLVHAGQVEQAALATLRKWIWTYIGFAEQRYGYQPRTLPNVRGWAIASTLDLDRWPEQQIPCLILISPGLAAEPYQRDDALDAAWRLDVGVIIDAGTQEAAHTLARVYAAAVRECLCQQAWDSELINDARWVGEAYDDTTVDKRRTLAAARLTFTVSVDDVVTFQPIPTTPDPLPDPPGGGYPAYPDTPTAETIDVTVTQLAQEG
jgi:hypothetical protein